MTRMGSCSLGHWPPPHRQHLHGLPLHCLRPASDPLRPAAHDLCRFQDAPAQARRRAARLSAADHKLHASAVDDTTSAARSDKAARVEAVLLVAGGALSTRRIAQLATLTDATEAKTLIEQLNTAYEHSRCAFAIERVAAGYQLLSRPQFAYWLDSLHNRPATLKLSSPMMETLTIVAYQQPIVRADIEAIRGVQCSEILKQLMEQNLVKVGGEDDSLGRPYLYITTRRFLEVFGLRTLADLPLRETFANAGSSQTSDDAPEDVPAEENDSLHEDDVDPDDDVDQDASQAA